MKPSHPVDRVKLAAARHRAGLTQKELVAAANRAGARISYGWLANVESGRMGARPDKLAVIARVLKVRLEDLTAPPDPGNKGAVAWLMEQVTELKRRVDSLELEASRRRASGG